METTSSRLVPDESYYLSERREMLAFIPNNARRFLDLGCGAGSFGGLIRENIPSACVTGIEIHPTAVTEARKRLNEVIEKPVEDALRLINPGAVDCVICNDILEHLIDPWAVLRQVRNILSKDGWVVASIPNIRYFPILKQIFWEGDWKYDKWGVLDQTHLRFFTKTSIHRLFGETGFRLTRIEGIFGELLPWKAALMNRVLSNRFEDARYERFACVATVNERQ